MRKIEPVPFFDNGVMKNANYLSIEGQDNMTNGCYFVYRLINQDSEEDEPKTLYQSGRYMGGEVYENYQTNDYAYEWIANELGLILINE
jgi:hypothetical protein